ncbi:hypothetical protein BC835DRAFT_1304184 [Cytidiella melzeri]|nr:hypothetical protein BC835DRAFT_1304184 [Cytidiella melzeri]
MHLRQPNDKKLRETAFVVSKLESRVTATSLRIPLASLRTRTMQVEGSNRVPLLTQENLTLRVNYDEPGSSELPAGVMGSCLMGEAATARLMGEPGMINLEETHHVWGMADSWLAARFTHLQRPLATSGHHTQGTDAGSYSQGLRSARTMGILVGVQLSDVIAVASCGHYGNPAASLRLVSGVPNELLTHFVTD